MRKIALCIIAALVCQMAVAQERTGAITQYKEFKPAVILLSNGKIFRQPLANIFLKNSSLLYNSGDKTMEANMDNILSVTFDDRQYIKIDTILAYKVDSVGSDALYKATVIDLVSYKNQLLNNRQITSLDLGDQISYSNVDISTEEDHLFPLVDKFFFRYKDQFVRVHERDIQRLLPKDKRRLFKSYISVPGFSWTDEKSLLNLLKGIQ